MGLSEFNALFGLAKLRNVKTYLPHNIISYVNIIKLPNWQPPPVDIHSHLSGAVQTLPSVQGDLQMARVTELNINNM